MPAIPVKHTKTTNAPWDAGAARKDLKEGQPASYYRDEFAWVDGAGDPTEKGSYKFPHHMVSSDGTVGDANIRACQSAIGILNGGMGGSQIPAGDHEAVYAHLAAHLKDANLTPPDLKKNSAPTDAKQFRINTIEKLQYRAASGDAPATVEGHAAVFNTLSPPLWQLGGAREQIIPGAFQRALSRGDDVKLLINHDASLILARSLSGTLQLKEDDKGLWFSASLPNTSYANDLKESMARGDVSQCSFAFCVDDADMEMVNGEPVQNVRSVQLSDVSIVTYPAYPETDASLRGRYQEIINTLNTTDDATVQANIRKRQIQMLELS